ncbi:hypothetical protein SO694_00036277 [Aureococcus anophagefferens]|uniref:PSII 6.1 kDa protein n=1 Tax=Aureococcus anophagefferens TaxID=44056 RepID=A0ABR1FLA9_AURAN
MKAVQFIALALGALSAVVRRSVHCCKLWGKKIAAKAARAPPHGRNRCRGQEAFAPKSSSSALMAARSGANSGVSQRTKALAASPKMEVWSEKNIRFSLLAGIGLPIVGIVTPPDNVLFAATLPVAIAGVWIFIFLDLLKAAIPGDEDFDFDV